MGGLERIAAEKARELLDESVFEAPEIEGLEIVQQALLHMVLQDYEKVMPLLKMGFLRWQDFLHTVDDDEFSKDFMYLSDDGTSFGHEGDKLGEIIGEGTRFHKFTSDEYMDRTYFTKTHALAAMIYSRVPGLMAKARDINEDMMRKSRGFLNSEIHSDNYHRIDGRGGYELAETNALASIAFSMAGDQDYAKNRLEYLCETVKNGGVYQWRWTGLRDNTEAAGTSDNALIAIAQFLNGNEKEANRLEQRINPSLGYKVLSRLLPDQSSDRQVQIYNKEDIPDLRSPTGSACYALLLNLLGNKEKAFKIMEHKGQFTILEPQAKFYCALAYADISRQTSFFAPPFGAERPFLRVK